MLKTLKSLHTHTHTHTHLLELINEFSKVAEYNINTQKSYISYTSKEQSKKEIKKTVPFPIASKRIKYFGINLTKKVKDVYTEN